VAAALANGYLAPPLRRGRVTWPVAALRVPGIGLGLMVCAAYMMSFFGIWAFFGTHLRQDLGVPTALAGLPPLLYGLGFATASVFDPMIDRYGPHRVAPVVFSALLGYFLVMVLSAGSAGGLIGLCILWGAINHFALNLIVGRLAGLDAARRGAILGLNTGVTYIAMFAGTALYGLVYREAGFAACTLVSATAILVAAVESIRRFRANALPGA
jgi:predicted MFS family arabinose efflux permease